MNNGAAILVEGLSVTYPDGRLALDNVSFSVAANEALALLGANGAGKSTLLLALVGIAKGSGSVAIDAEPLSESNLPHIRQTAQLLFQDPNDQLFMPALEDDVAFGPLNFGVPAADVPPLVSQSLTAVGLAGFESRDPHNMSLGERKRAALATVLACRPRALLLDEPSAGLDPRGKRELVGLLKGLRCTKLIATHDLDFARETCDAAAVLSAGRIVAAGKIAALLSDGPLLASCGLA